MSTARLSFSINRISVPSVPFAQFAALVKRLGVSAIEIRNDLPDVEMRDHAPASQIGAIAAEHGLTIRSINALQRFEQFDAARAEEAQELARYAAECGAQALVLCPTNSLLDQRSPEQRHADLVAALQGLRPILQAHGLMGLIEPLGFEECAVRKKSMAVRAIQEVGGQDVFRLVHDTFHHHLSGEDSFFPALTGLVHISGVEDTGVSVSDMRDPHRVLVSEADRLGNVRQLRTLLAAGYDGLFSFEPFATEIGNAPDIELRLADSMAYLSAAVKD